VGLNGEDKGPSGIDMVPFVERKFEGAAWSCVLGTECVWMVYILEDTLVQRFDSMTGVQ